MINSNLKEVKAKLVKFARTFSKPERSNYITLKSIMTSHAKQERSKFVLLFML